MLDELRKTKPDNDTRNVEAGFFDLSLPIATSRIHSFTGTNVEDVAWSGIHELMPGYQIVVGNGFRDDLLILRGSISSESSEYREGDFLMRCSRCQIRAGNDGVRLFRYRDRLRFGMADVTAPRAGREWLPGKFEGLSVSPLVTHLHHLLLVRWQPGTKLPFHDHPRGEEVFVLSGQFEDQRGRYPAGHWQRLHPGSGHAPSIREDTLVLLRNGHL